MQPIPSEFVVGGVSVPPMLIAAFVGTTPAWRKAKMPNRFRVSRFFASPPLVLISLAVVYTALLGICVIPARIQCVES